VLVTYTDDLVPPPYRPYVSESAQQPFAISLLLTPPGAAALRCRLGRHKGSPPDQPAEAALIRFLVEGAGQALLGADQTWRLERAHAG